MIARPPTCRENPEEAHQPLYTPEESRGTTSTSGIQMLTPIANIQYPRSGLLADQPETSASELNSKLKIIPTLSDTLKVVSI